MATFFEYGDTSESVMEQLMHREREKQCLAGDGHTWAYIRAQAEALRVMHHTTKPVRECLHCSRVELLDEGEVPPPDALFMDDLVEECPCCKEQSGPHVH